MIPKSFVPNNKKSKNLVDKLKDHMEKELADSLKAKPDKRNEVCLFCTHSYFKSYSQSKSFLFCYAQSQPVSPSDTCGTYKPKPCCDDIPRDYLSEAKRKV